MYLVRYSIVTPYVLKEYEYIDYTFVNESTWHTRHFSLIFNIAVMLINTFMQLANRGVGCSAVLYLSWAG